MPEAPTRFRDRESGRVLEEPVFGGGALHFLYGDRRGRLLTDWVLTRSLPHLIYGWMQRAPSSRRKIPQFIRSLAIDAHEAEHPLDHYRSLDDFFTRRLKPESRPIDRTPAHFISPADGRALAFARLPQTLPVKGAEVGLDELLGDRALAARYAGGAALVVRLAPADYHRFHFPEAGEASVARPIAGPLHSVHPIALAHRAPSFRNKRVVSTLTTDRFGTLTLVEVGALCVGTIVESYRPGPVARGQEKGLFRFGGSTVVVLAEPDRLVFDDDLIEATRDGIESRVKMGSRVGRALGEVK